MSGRFVDETDPLHRRASMRIQSASRSAWSEGLREVVRPVCATEGMARISVIDLARELGVRPAELMALAGQIGVRIARMAASLPESQAERVRRYILGIDIHRGPEGTTIVRPKGWSARTARAQERVSTEDRFGKLHHSIGEHMTTLGGELDDEAE